MSFVHLGVHSEFSIVDSIVRIGELAKQAADFGMPAVALTDLNNLFGTVKFYQACLKHGVKPIIGAEVMVETAEQRVYLYAMSNHGYKNLTQLISVGYTQGKFEEASAGQPVVSFDQLQELSEDLICVLPKHSAVGEALLSQNPERGHALFEHWYKVFADRLYLGVSRTWRQQEDAYIEQVARLSQSFADKGVLVGVVAVNDVRFVTPEDFEAHEARVCIASSRVLADQDRPKLYSDQQYFKSAEQMRELFSDISTVADNTVELAKRCNVTIELGKNYLPDFPVPAGQDENSHLKQLSFEGLEKRLEFTHPVEERGEDWEQTYAEYATRMEFELGIIERMGFPGYFLIVMDFIKWAKENDVPVGPGRGSGAGSLVAYSLLITDLDPLEYDLLFERFLNPERVSMPDFDIDFCVQGRDRVIDYVASKYGRDAVSQIITFGTMAAKAVVRDVARVQGKSYGLADKISKLIPGTPGISLAQAVAEEPQLKALLSDETNPDHEDATEVWEMAEKLEGLTRNVGKHAGGVLIAKGKISDFTAVFTDEDGHRTSHFDKDDVEKVGLVKFDFLGLKNLTIINAAVKSINLRLAQTNQPLLNIERIPLNDSATYNMLQQGQSTAVFQLESSGMKRYLKMLKPTNINDVIAMCALYRPGPLETGMVEMYINRKHGREEVVYDHELLAPVLDDTYGVIVYQEQVMQISQVMGNYTLGGADLLRRAMGKKKPEEMEKQRAVFEAGASSLGIDSNIAVGVFDLMEKFAGYGFNKSHSAAYGIVAYQTAYLKRHFTSEFMAEVLTFDAQNTDNVVFFIDDCRSFGIEVTPPSINDSRFKFVAKDKQTIVYGLSAIKGVGEGAVESLVQEREANGPYSDLFEFCKRVDLKKVNKRCLESLIKAGAFDCLSGSFESRASLWEQLPEATQAAEQSRKSQEIGMMDLFGDVTEAQQPLSHKEVPAWTDAQRLKGEKSTLGLYLTGHPLDSFEHEIRQLTSKKISELEPTGYKETAKVVGLVIDVANFGNRISITLEDQSGRLEVSCYPEKYEAIKQFLSLESIFIANVRLSQREGDDRVYARLESGESLENHRLFRLRGLILQNIELNNASLIHNITEFVSAAKQQQGLNLSCELRAELHSSYAKGEFKLKQPFAPTDTMIAKANQLFGADNLLFVHAEYAHEDTYS